MTLVEAVQSLNKRPRLVAFALTLFLFAPVLVFGQVRYDDHWLWADDSPLRQPTASVLRDVFFELDARSRHPYGTEYLPVRDLVVAAEMAIWGENEQGPHAVQLALYILTVLGLGSLLVRFGVRPSISWLAAMLWAAHPLHVESVAWLSERKGILAGLFFVACGHAWIRFRRAGSRWWLVLAVLTAIAAVWSKAPGMFGVAVLAALDLLLLPHDRRRWIAIAAVGVATGLAAIPVVLVALDGRIISEASTAGITRLEAALGAQGHYIEGLLLARTGSISYPIITDGPGAVEIALGVAATIGSVALALRWWHDKTKRHLLAMLAWAWIWFVPISHLVFSVHILVADRFAYLWSFAACVFAAALIHQLRPPWRAAAAAMLLCVLGVATIRAQNAWTNSVELFAHAFETNPRDPKACENLAMALVDDARPQEALAILDRGLHERPGHPHLLSRKANVLMRLNRRDDALAASRAAAQTHYASAMWSHAVLLRAAGRPREAFPWAALAARRHPHIDAYMETYVQLLVETGRAAYARGVLAAWLVRDPGSALANRMLASLPGD